MRSRVTPQVGLLVEICKKDLCRGSRRWLHRNALLPSRHLRRNAVRPLSSAQGRPTNPVVGDSGDQDNDMSADLRPITSFVKKQMEQGKLRQDREQLDLARKLDDLRTAVAKTDSRVIPDHQLVVDMFWDAKPKGLLARAQKLIQSQIWFSRTRESPKGVYIHGSVGVGKSFLMDLLASELLRDNHEKRTCCQRRKIRRSHFHEFMLDVHDRIHKHKQIRPKEDPLPSVALSLAKEARILCLDEFQVTDIADAMILQRLFGMLWMESNNWNFFERRDIGMVVVATSNRAPEALYEGGLNRALFLPFIETLKRHMDVVEMHGSNDYRRDNNNHQSNDTQQSFFWPATSSETRQALQDVFAAAADSHDGIVRVHDEDITLPVRMGRHVRVPKSNNACAWFDFEDLCGAPLGAADYLAICERFPVLIVDHVPQLNASRFNEARRFVTLVDAIYESRTRLILAAQVPLEDLLLHFDATVESNDGDEEIAVAGVGQNATSTVEEEQIMFVKGQGGSSSSASTTYLRSKEGEMVEWSATGRIGVSLAQLSAVRDVSFSFLRAESRLVEMNNGRWGRSY
ncbi:AFG1-like ATPase [Seminavis robusta]|uniref:AFG1-like ATPase n=1 Tax=Seminavis robusta TaxID=568900 RepID=A0A9N8HPE2_9STRA|nr:AFG1-like ATPase [Seminavis robusta]|eukprot:Sro1319_g262340.1 AFG1-like ATPase (572) ;mRNA; f:29546-31261